MNERPEFTQLSAALRAALEQAAIDERKRCAEVCLAAARTYRDAASTEPAGSRAGGDLTTMALAAEACAADIGVPPGPVARFDCRDLRVIWRALGELAVLEGPLGHPLEVDRERRAEVLALHSRVGALIDEYGEAVT